MSSLEGHRQQETAVHPITSSDGPDDADLLFLEDMLRGRRIVFLGENGHGVREFHALKARLATFLVSRMGFDLLAFESGMIEGYEASVHANDHSAEELLTKSLFRLWHSRDLLRLFGFIKDSASALHPLAFIGLDCRPLSGAGPSLANLVRIADQALLQRLIDVETRMKRWGRKGFIQTSEDLDSYARERAACRDVYEAVLEAIRSDADDGIDAARHRSVIERAIENRMGLLEVFADEDAFFAFRESTMADNLAWIAETLYPEKRIVVWAHDYHVRKRQSDVDGFPSLFERLPSHIQAQSYVLTLCMYRGQAVWNNRAPYDIPPASEGSMECRLHAYGFPIVFCDIAAMREQGDGWTHMPQTMFSWGVTGESIVPDDQYDGVIVVESVHPPEFIDGALPT